MSAIHVRNLCVAVEGHDLVANVSIDVREGTWCTVVGPNGAGKTTLVETVAGIRSPRSGEVTIGDASIHQLRERRRAQLVAFVPQHPVVPTGMSVRDYIGLGRTAHQGVLQGVSDEGWAIVEGILDRLGLTALALRDVATLSGGERQRSVIARAMAQSTTTMVLDEPTTGLDLRHQIETLEILRREVDACGLTVLATLHDLTLAGQFADELVLLHEGRVLTQGPSREVVRSAELGRAYRMDLRVVDVDGADVIVPYRPLPVIDEARLASPTTHSTLE